jgi:hypothetical protein
VPTNSRSEPGLAAPAAAAGLAAFALLATLNSGGYRYGVSDQSFYIPAVLHHLDPALFPRDWAMLGAQGRYFLVDEMFAGAAGLTGASLPWLFLAAQALTLTALYVGALWLGRAVLTSAWAMTAWLTALTLRHRLQQTGVNTLEGYFHPRMLVCGLGLMSLGLLLRGRPWWALGLAGASAAIHPTTAACFVAIVGTAILVTEPRARLPLGAAVVAVAAIVLIRAWQGGGPFDLNVMNPGWRALVATKDYTFPARWTWDTWVLNLLRPVLLVGAMRARARAGLLRPVEVGVLAGCLLLVAGFFASLPLIDRGVALAVQLQTSRVFWPVELVATLYVVWWLVEAPAAAAHPQRARALAVVLIAASIVRGVYVGVFESPERPTFAVDLPDDDWTRALRWVGDHTPSDAFVLADPGHTYKSGTAVRIGARRDVYLEEVKDVAMSMYSATTAARVQERIDRVAGFPDLPAAALQDLAAREGLTVLVTDGALELPVLHRSGAITVYRLGS